MPHITIADLAGVYRRSVQRYLDEFDAGGLERLPPTTWQGPLSGLTRHHDCLKAYFLENRPRTTREAQDAIHIELLFLLSYSPYLNLIERLWKFGKEESLAFRPAATYKAFIRSIDDCLDNTAAGHQAPLATLLTLELQTFDDVAILTA